jgi:uncharacterized membrane protein YfcA
VLAGSDYVFAALAALAAGGLNAIAGGGTLISFPVLTAIGLSPVAANVTNTVALCPGFFGGTFAQRRDLVGQGRRLAIVVPVGVAGGILGGVLLFWSGERTFDALVPFLILMAAGLLASQETIAGWLGHRTLSDGSSAPHPHGPSEVFAALPVAAGAVYGGYFGAGLGVILLATLGLALRDSFTRLNALKQVIALAVNLSAAIFFAFSGQVAWDVALVMAVGALVGGSVGGRFASRVRPRLLRRIVVAIGVVIGIIYLVR